MSIMEYFDKLKDIQKEITEYLDEEVNIEEGFQNIVNIFDNQKILESKHKTKSALYLISNISNNHHRDSNFINKIETILNYFKNDIKKYFSNNEIFSIFHKNKRILLFLIKNNIIIVDEDFYNQITKSKFSLKLYPQYFFNEIRLFIKIDEQKSKKKNSFSNDIIYDTYFHDGIPENFEEKREIGENDDYICQLIRNDMIDNFITYVNKNEISVDINIKPSIYETNDFLLKHISNLTLINYAAFFGSAQIFKYLYLNNALVIPKIWLFAIHGDNPEIIHFIEDKYVRPSHEIEKQSTTITCKEILEESIKCHHNNITNYILENYINEKDFYDNILKCFDENIYSYCLHYYNFLYLPDEIKNEIFYYACKYDHFIVVDDFIKNKNINSRDHIITKNTFSYSLKN